MSCLLSPLVYLTVVNNTSVVFAWFVNITTVAGLIGWVVIQVTYLRFFAGLKKQGYSRKDLPYKSPFQPYVAWATLLMVSLVILFCGFDVFVKGRFTAQGFITCYINIAIFAVLYTIFKIRLRSKVIPTSEIELSEEFRSIREEKQQEEAN
ncbi:hypothetical protein FOMA001_g13970 [Fusarium oxysporum f. sp. matthiolae]|nr:hypothetical protein FOMA001_g13970 [Fusarium oxysporum f. sp. matthiolae]